MPATPLERRAGTSFGRSSTPTSPDTIAPMATRTSLRVHEPEGTAPDGSNLPAVRPDDLRRHLPGIEPERQLNDWGRSERVEGFFDRTIVDFFYKNWFR